MRWRDWVVALALGLSVLAVRAEDRPDAAQISKLIEQMGSGDFDEREKATRALDQIGAPALEALRKATSSDDAEIKKRAQELVGAIERRAESRQLLGPKMVRLQFKDTPLAEAVADLSKRSGYPILLNDPEGKLKDVKVTLDTGETTFWQALDLFCQKAGLVEGNPN